MATRDSYDILWDPARRCYVVRHVALRVPGTVAWQAGVAVTPRLDGSLPLVLRATVEGYAAAVQASKGYPSDGAKGGGA